MSIQDLRNSLCNTFVERDAEIDAIILGLVSRQHVLLISSTPGLAKSAIMRQFGKLIDGCQANWLVFSKFTTPEEIFGYQDLKKLMEDRAWARNSEGTLTTSHLYMADEVWKSSSASVNTLLSAMQERTIRLDGKAVKLQLRMMVGASNEWPNDENHAESMALFDRFTIRLAVNPIGAQFYRELRAKSRNLALADRNGSAAVAPVCTLAEIDAAADLAVSLPRSEEYEAAYDEILSALAEEQIVPGDRRICHGDQIAAAQAVIEGYSEVRPHHLEVLQDVLWNDPEQAATARPIVQRIANPVGAKLNDLLRQVDEVVRSATDGASRIAAVQSMDDCEKQARDLAKDGNGRSAAVLKRIEDERTKLVMAALGGKSGSLEALLKRGDKK